MGSNFMMIVLFRTRTRRNLLFTYLMSTTEEQPSSHRRFVRSSALARLSWNRAAHLILWTASLHVGPRTYGAEAGSSSLAPEAQVPRR